MLRVSYQEMRNVFQTILAKYGFSEERAAAAAEIFAGNSLCGVYSHGLNRFPRVINYLERGLIDPGITATVEIRAGAFERWNGNRGFGPLNAKLAMDRACDLASQYGIGIVALGNNNHWMRGGSYGFQAADRGFVGICWTNTLPNMPAWGGMDVKIGNNPIVFAIPRENGKHVVIDCAVAQFSYGKIEVCKFNGQQLPVYGGYDTKGNLTTDPVEIEKTMRVLPMGYWKGSGLSIALDMIATILSDGNSVAQVGTFEEELGLTQIMIAIDPSKGNEAERIEEIVNQIIADVKSSIPVDKNKPVLYPGEPEAIAVEDNTANGIPVEESIWKALLKMI